MRFILIEKLAASARKVIALYNKGILASVLISNFSNEYVVIFTFTLSSGYDSTPGDIQWIKKKLIAREIMKKSLKDSWK